MQSPALRLLLLFLLTVGLAACIDAPDGGQSGGELQCQSDGECEGVLGLGHRCGDAGFCVSLARPEGIPCGTGGTCLPGQRCADVPDDGCDPLAGGQDCDGTCEPDQAAIDCGTGAAVCPSDLVCIDDPIDGCDPLDGGSDCAGFCGSAAMCGGFAGILCTGDLTCIDDPRDDCGELGADCSGICV